MKFTQMFFIVSLLLVPASPLFAMKKPGAGAAGTQVPGVSDQALIKAMQKLTKKVVLCTAVMSHKSGVYIVARATLNRLVWLVHLYYFRPDQEKFQPEDLITTLDIAAIHNEAFPNEPLEAGFEISSLFFQNKNSIVVGVKGKTTAPFLTIALPCIP